MAARNHLDGGKWVEDRLHVLREGLAADCRTGKDGKEIGRTAKNYPTQQKGPYTLKNIPLNSVERHKPCPSKTWEPESADDKHAPLDVSGRNKAASMCTMSACVVFCAVVVDSMYRRQKTWTAKQAERNLKDHLGLNPVIMNACISLWRMKTEAEQEPFNFAQLNQILLKKETIDDEEITELRKTYHLSNYRTRGGKRGKRGRHVDLLKGKDIHLLQGKILVFLEATASAERAFHKDVARQREIDERVENMTEQERERHNKQQQSKRTREEKRQFEKRNGVVGGKKEDGHRRKFWLRFCSSSNKSALETRIPAEILVGKAISHAISPSARCSCLTLPHPPTRQVRPATRTHEQAPPQQTQAQGSGQDEVVDRV